MDSLFAGAVALSHRVVGGVLKSGDTAVDATVGNGHDTLFMANLVGKGGTVFAFDIQEAALRTTDRLLSEAGVTAWVQLLHDGHEQMTRHVPPGVRAVMFNLGYLPGGDHNIITLPETTCAAVDQGLRLLLSGGVMTVVVYRGHAGAEIEAGRVEEMLALLPRSGWDVARVDLPNRRGSPPYLLAARKR